MNEKQRNLTKNVLTYMVCAYILSYVLPAGVIAGVQIQTFLVAAIAAGALVVFIQQKSILEMIKQSFFEIAVVIAGLLWCIMGWRKGMEWNFTVFTLLYIGVVILLIIRWLIKYDFLDIRLMVQCLLIMMIVKIAVKLLIEIAFLTGILEYESVSQLYFQVFSTEATTMTMDFGSIEMVRIQDSSDAIVFTLLPFYWFMPERKRGERVALFIASGLYALIVFSRIYLIEFACFTVVAVIYYWKNIPRKQKKILIGLLLILMAVLAKPMMEMLRFRFFSSFTAESDTVRAVQMTKLWDGIKENLWIGHGMGSFLPDYIRSETLPFSYEIEYLSFLYQFGILGFFLIIGGILAIYLKQIYPYFKNNPRVVQAVSILGAGWFAVRPFLNPAFLGKQNQFLLIGIFLINVWYASKSKSDQMLNLK